MTTIKKGFRLTVTSWECDADNYKTAYMEGLSRPEAEFVVAFVKLFNSQNDRKNRGIGNMYEPEDSEVEEANSRIEALVEEYRNTIENSGALEYFLNEGKFNEDGWHEFAYELALAGDGFWTRVMDSFTVEFVQADVYLEDVTKEFE